MPSRQLTPKYQRQRQFAPREKEQERELLLSDDVEFSRTKHYLDGLILDALDRYELTATQLGRLHRELLDDVPLAAQRYLSSEKSQDADYKFSTYFTWYIAERVNTVEGLRRKST